MDFDTAVGSLVAVGALVAVIGLYAWSCRIVNRISEGNLTSLRQIRRELNNGSK